MSGLILPGDFAPSNLHLLPGQSTRFVEGDVFNIAERVKEVDPSLHIVQLDSREYPYAVMEHCQDGVERLVFKCKALDNRVVERLRYLMARPFDERFAELEREEFKFEQDRKEAELERLYHELGDPMRYQLERDGFITSRGKSYAKRGVTGNKGSRDKS